MRNFGQEPNRSDDWGANDPNHENIDSPTHSENGESNARDYEKTLAEVSDETVFLAEQNMDRLLADLTWRVPGGPSRERYDKEDRKIEIDRLRLFAEAETLFDYNLERDAENLPESKFFRHLADTCQHDHQIVDTVPLSKSEEEHFSKSAGDFIKHLSSENPKERSFAAYIKSLIMMCDSAYGKDSRAMMYLNDDLNQLLAPQTDAAGNTIDNKSKIIDRLIERKLNTVQKIAMGKTTAPAPSGRVLIGFTGTLDLPEGIENRSVKELAEEGVPSLYGYNL